MEFKRVQRCGECENLKVFDPNWSHDVCRDCYSQKATEVVMGNENVVITENEVKEPEESKEQVTEKVDCNLAEPTEELIIVDDVDNNPSVGEEPKEQGTDRMEPMVMVEDKDTVQNDGNAANVVEKLETRILTEADFNKILEVLRKIADIKLPPSTCHVLFCQKGITGNRKLHPETKEPVCRRCYEKILKIVNLKKFRENYEAKLSQKPDVIDLTDDSDEIQSISVSTTSNNLSNPLGSIMGNNLLCAFTPTSSGTIATFSVHIEPGVDVTGQSVQGSRDNEAVENHSSNLPCLLGQFATPPNLQEFVRNNPQLFPSFSSAPGPFLNPFGLTSYTPSLMPFAPNLASSTVSSSGQYEVVQRSPTNAPESSNIVTNLYDGTSLREASYLTNSSNSPVSPMGIFNTSHQSVTSLLQKAPSPGSAYLIVPSTHNLSSQMPITPPTVSVPTVSAQPEEKDDNWSQLIRDARKISSGYSAPVLSTSSPTASMAPSPEDTEDYWTKLKKDARQMCSSQSTPVPSNSGQVATPCQSGQTEDYWAKLKNDAKQMCSSFSSRVPSPPRPISALSMAEKPNQQNSGFPSHPEHSIQSLSASRLSASSPDEIIDVCGPYTPPIQEEPIPTSFDLATSTSERDAPVLDHAEAFSTPSIFLDNTQEPQDSATSFDPAKNPLEQDAPVSDRPIELKAISSSPILMKRLLASPESAISSGLTSGKDQSAMSHPTGLPEPSVLADTRSEPQERTSSCSEPLSRASVPSILSPDGTRTPKPAELTWTKATSPISSSTTSNSLFSIARPTVQIAQSFSSSTPPIFTDSTCQTSPNPVDSTIPMNEASGILSNLKIAVPSDNEFSTFLSPVSIPPSPQESSDPVEEKLTENSEEIAESSPKPLKKRRTEKTKKEQICSNSMCRAKLVQGRRRHPDIKDAYLCPTCFYHLERYGKQRNLKTHPIRRRGVSPKPETAFIQNMRKEEKKWHMNGESIDVDMENENQSGTKKHGNDERATEGSPPAIAEMSYYDYSNLLIEHLDPPLQYRYDMEEFFESQPDVQKLDSSLEPKLDSRASEASESLDDVESIEVDDSGASSPVSEVKREEKWPNIICSNQHCQTQIRGVFRFHPITQDKICLTCFKFFNRAAQINNSEENQTCSEFKCKVPFYDKRHVLWIRGKKTCVCGDCLLRAMEKREAEKIESKKRKLELQSIFGCTDTECHAPNKEFYDPNSEKNMCRKCFGEVWI